VGLDARATPLSRVLDILARETGMKVVYNGPAPTQLVTASFSRRSLGDVVSELLAGLGLGYGMGGDAKTVTILVVVTNAASAGPGVAHQDRDDEERAAAEEDWARIPTELQSLLPPPPDPATLGIPPPLQALMAERDRSTAVPGAASAPMAAIPPALLPLTPHR
jgi:hypothetical protein